MRSDMLKQFLREVIKGDIWRLGENINVYFKKMIRDYGIWIREGSNGVLV
jgi:hypothetical protein